MKENNTNYTTLIADLILWDLLSSEEDQISLTFTGWKFTPLNVISFKPTVDEVPPVELVPG